MANENNKPKIKILLEGGIVQAVYGDIELEIEVVDPEEIEDQLIESGMVNDRDLNRRVKEVVVKKLSGLKTLY